ncbi:MAG: alginate export family protein [Verrucomicrobiota bacterium]
MNDEKVFLIGFWLSGILTLNIHAEPPTISPFRWLEDYSYLSEKETLNSYEQIKFLPLQGDAYLSLGGSVRERLNVFGNDRFGLLPIEDDGNIFLQRILLHGDLYINEHFRTFVEFGSYLNFTHEIQSGPFDENNMDLAQAFADLSLANYRLRVGRQHISLGSARLVSLRNGPNVRQNFDGIRVDSEIFGGDITLLATYETEIKKYAFDDDADYDSSLWGVYTTWDYGLTKADFYYLGTYRGNRVYTQGSANETRHSLGSRLFGKQGAWDWNYEFIYQLGDFGNADISAWTVATINGYTFERLPWSPRVELSMNIASGDDDPNDNELNTFNPLFPKLPYFEEASVLVPQNFFNVDPAVTLHPLKSLSVKLDWNLFWRLEDEEAVYSRGLRPLPGTANQSGNFVAHVPSIYIKYQLNRYLAFDLTYSHFFAGGVITDAGGDDIDFGMVSVTWSF